MPFKKGFDPNRRMFSDVDRAKSALLAKQRSQEFYNTTPFEKLSKLQKYKRVKQLQNYTCKICNNDTWQNQPITLEIDHKDGNKQNNTRDNLRAICPNCHAQTPTWRKKKSALVVKR